MAQSVDVFYYHSEKTYVQWLLDMQAAGMRLFVVGSQAMVRQGLPRQAMDLDVVYERSAVPQLRQLLEGLGPNQRVGNESTFVTIYTPDGVLDLGFHLPGVSFDEAYAAGVDLDYWGVTVRSATVEVMYAIKQVQEGRRPKDGPDIAWMKRTLEKKANA